MAKSLKALQELKNKEVDSKAPVAATTETTKPADPVAEKTPKAKRPLPEGFGKKKDEAKAAAEKEISDAILAIVTANPAGLSVKEISKSIFNPGEEIPEKQIRGFCRDLGLVSEPIPGTRTVKYVKK